MWPGSQTILDLNGRDFLTISDCFQNFINFGDIGSAKTTGAVQNTNGAFIRNGFGGLYCCVKIGAAADYIRWAADAERTEDIVHFGVGREHAFNFLDYTVNRVTDKTSGVDDVAHVLVEGMQVLEPAKAQRDAFFVPWGRELLKAEMTALVIAYGRLDLRDLSEFLSTMPRDGNDIYAGDTFCSKTLRQAWTRAQGTKDEETAESLTRFFHVDWANWAHETRESIRATAQVVVNALCTEPLLTLFGKATTVTPTDILGGKLVVVDIPILLRERIGKIANTIWKTSVQRAVLARPIPEYGKEASVRPVFILADEAQFIVTSGDQLFVSSSREHRSVTFFATQTINSLIDVIGEPATKSLLGGLRNAFVNRTSDADTAKWFRDSTNQVINQGLNEGPTAWALHDFSTELLRTLKQGGKDRRVEAIFRRGNDRFKVNGLRWCKVTFRQSNLVAKTGMERLLRMFTSNDARILIGGK